MFRKPKKNEIMSKQFEKLLKKHISGELNEVEKKDFASYLQHLDNQLFLASTIDNDFIEEHGIIEVNEEVGMKLWHSIQQKIGLYKIDKELEETDNGRIFIRQGYNKMLFKAIAVAASIIIIISSVLFLSKDESSKQIAHGTKMQKLIYEEKNIRNTSGEVMKFSMSDGTIIFLANKSEITYMEPFQGNRNIHLIGKALFKVHKDKVHPFTVFSGAISTTALGTKFAVRDFVNEKKIVVSLFEGKVVIRPISKNNSKMKKEVFLMPGEVFVYETKNNSLSVKNKVRAINKENFDRPSLPENVTGAWYMFNNQPLSQVLQNLSSYNNVKILFNNDDIRNIYFTGKYNNSESTETILKRIAKMNNLELTKRDSTYQLTKSITH